MQVNLRVALVARALWELAAYDLVTRLFGFQGIEWRVRHVKSASIRVSVSESDICEAMRWALSLCWKRVRCLQRAVVTARLLNRYSAEMAEIVIGYRPAPFLSHAWVEVNGRVVNDSSSYKKQLRVLTRIPNGPEKMLLLPRDRPPSEQR